MSDELSTTILLLVSRDEYLEEVFEALNNLVCNSADIALLCLVNGDNNLFVQTRNYCETSKYAERLTVHVKTKEKIRRYDISGRRKRISELHNYAKTLINTEYIFGVEDDTIIPPDALEKLGEQLIAGVGIVEGVEMGRWGVPYIGAWIANDIHNPTEIVSLHYADNQVIDVDACGFYCFLVRAEDYKHHTFKPFDNNGLGPDVDFSLSLRRKGLHNIAHFGVKCIHKDHRGDVEFGKTKPKQVQMYLKNKRWRQNVLHK